MPSRFAAHLARAAAPFVLVACTSMQPAPTASLYDRLGGRDAIAAVVDDSVVRIAADPRINQRFGRADVPHLKKSLVDLLCVRAGGPCAYDGLGMADAHEGMQIRGDEFDALLDDIARSLDQAKVPPRERREVLAALGQMRNAVIDH